MKNTKLVKGVIAGGLGLALLLGGSTFALWYDTGTATGGEVSSGELSFTVGAQSWSVVANDTTGAEPTTTGGTAISDIDTFRMVPGDTVIYSASLAINAVGDTLEAKLTVDTSDLTGDAALAAAINGSSKTTVTVNGESETFGTSAEFTVTPEDAGTVPVLITLHFPAATDGDTPVADGSRSNWWGTTAQNETVTLADLTLTLEQTLS